MRLQSITHHIILILSVFLFVCIASSGWCQTTPTPATEKDKVVATVNNAAIMQHELAQEVSRELRKYRKYGMKKASPELMKTLNKRALDRIIDNEVLSQAIRKHTTNDFEHKAKQEFKSMKEKFSSPESFDQYLKTKQMTEESLLISLKNKMQVNEYLESQGVLHFEPTEEEIQSFYNERKESFKKEEQVKVRHILIQVAADADESEKNAARQKAEDIRKKIMEGQDFGKLAEEYSDCQRSKNKGGDLGYIQHGFMPEGFDKVAFNIEKNTPSQVVTSNYGFHVLEVLEKEPAEYLPVDQVREYLIKYIENKQVNKIRTEHVQHLRKQADIEIFLD